MTSLLQFISALCVAALDNKTVRLNNLLEKLEFSLAESPYSSKDECPYTQLIVAILTLLS
jgi:hypothetical protein